MKPILDMTAGSRMFWWDKHNPLAVFLDKRRETFTVTYHNAGREPFDKEIEIEPDVQWDWAKKDLPFENNQFSLVVFDPPHLLHAGKTSWLARKYGVLDEDWQNQLKRGMDEAMRVLKPYGTVMFKWNDDQIKLSEVLKAIGRKPIFGDKKAKTHWLVFMKEAEK
ncbi:SAM-dependent methyltransferase [Lacticaseibacillus paracasei]|uniref:SAM-dependent methyltransferase n=1 Tax=Lacticaseibacillus paracasei TaxID=1597 RepID=UPI000F817988|nr:SAM-dependent methyltransferase [Lacticaseibacillus paracasei]RUS38515.1 SAM-dependent methyltransferase [Lacticaseibacillus paracasei]